MRPIEDVDGDLAQAVDFGPKQPPKEPKQPPKEKKPTKKELIGSIDGPVKQFTLSYGGGQSGRAVDRFRLRFARDKRAERAAQTLSHLSFKLHDTFRALRDASPDRKSLPKDLEVQGMLINNRLVFASNFNATVDLIAGVTLPPGDNPPLQRLLNLSQSDAGRRRHLSHQDADEYVGRMNRSHIKLDAAFDGVRDSATAGAMRANRLVRIADAAPSTAVGRQQLRQLLTDPEYQGAAIMLRLDTAGANSVHAEQKLMLAVLSAGLDPDDIHGTHVVMGKYRPCLGCWAALHAYAAEGYPVNFNDNYGNYYTESTRSIVDHMPHLAGPVAEMVNAVAGQLMSVSALSRQMPPPDATENNGLEKVIPAHDAPNRGYVTASDSETEYFDQQRQYVTTKRNLDFATNSRSHTLGVGKAKPFSARAAQRVLTEDERIPLAAAWRSGDTAHATALFKYHSARGVSNVELSEASGASAGHVGRLINDKDGHEKRDGRDKVKRRVQSRSGRVETASTAGSSTSKFTKRPPLDSNGQKALRDAMRDTDFYSGWKRIEKGIDKKELQARHIPPALNDTLDQARRLYNIQSIADYLHMKRKSLQQHLDKRYGSVNEAATKNAALTRQPSPIDEEMPDAGPSFEPMDVEYDYAPAEDYDAPAEDYEGIAEYDDEPAEGDADALEQEAPANTEPIYAGEDGETIVTNDRGTQFYFNRETGRWQYFDEHTNQWYDYRPDDPYGKGKNTRWAVTDVTGTHETAPPATELDAGIALLDADQEDNWQAARRYQPRPNEFVVFAHGTPEGIVVGNKLVTPEQLAQRINEDTRSHGKQIVLISCDTGAGDFDVRLSQQPGITAVTAPTRTAWVTPDGRVISASPDLNEAGNWRHTSGHPPVSTILPGRDLPATKEGAVAFGRTKKDMLADIDGAAKKFTKSYGGGQSGRAVDEFRLRFARDKRAERAAQTLSHLSFQLHDTFRALRDASPNKSSLPKDLEVQGMLINNRLVFATNFNATVDLLAGATVPAGDGPPLRRLISLDQSDARRRAHLPQQDADEYVGRMDRSRVKLDAAFDGVRDSATAQAMRANEVLRIADAAPGSSQGRQRLRELLTGDDYDGAVILLRLDDAGDDSVHAEQKLMLAVLSAGLDPDDIQGTHLIMGKYRPCLCCWATLNAYAGEGFPVNFNNNYGNYYTESARSVVDHLPQLAGPVAQSIRGAADGLMSVSALSRQAPPDDAYENDGPERVIPAHDAPNRGYVTPSDSETEYFDKQRQYVTRKRNLDFATGSRVRTLGVGKDKPFAPRAAQRVLTEDERAQLAYAWRSGDAAALFKYHSARGVSNAELGEASGASASHVGRLIKDKDGHEKRDGRDKVTRRVQSRSGRSDTASTAGSSKSKFTKRPDLDSDGRKAIRDAMDGTKFKAAWKEIEKQILLKGTLRAGHLPDPLNQELSTLRHRYNMQSIADYLHIPRKSLQQHLDKRFGSVNEAATKSAAMTRQPSPIDEEMPDAAPSPEPMDVEYDEAPAGTEPIYAGEDGNTIVENDRGTQFYLDPETGRWQYFDEHTNEWHDYRPDDPYGKGKNTRWAVTDVRGTHETAPPVAEVDAGIALLDPGQEENWQAARDYRPKPNEFVVFAHGTPEGIVVGNKLVTPEQLAQRINEDTRSHGKQIVLISCDTAASDYDVRLAQQPGITAVTAPTRTAWVTPNGRVLSASPDLNEQGNWRHTSGHPPVSTILPGQELPTSKQGAVAFGRTKKDMLAEIDGAAKGFTKSYGGGQFGRAVDRFRLRFARDKRAERAAQTLSHLSFKLHDTLRALRDASPGRKDLPKDLEVQGMLINGRLVFATNFNATVDLLGRARIPEGPGTPLQRLLSIEQSDAGRRAHLTTQDADEYVGRMRRSGRKLEAAFDGARDSATARAMRANDRLRVVDAAPATAEGRQRLHQLLTHPDYRDTTIVLRHAASGDDSVHAEQKLMLAVLSAGLDPDDIQGTHLIMGKYRPCLCCWATLNAYAGEGFPVNFNNNYGNYYTESARSVIDTMPHLAGTVAAHIRGAATRMMSVSALSRQAPPDDAYENNGPEKVIPVEDAPNRGYVTPSDSETEWVEKRRAYVTTKRNLDLATGSRFRTMGVGKDKPFAPRAAQRVLNEAEQAQLAAAWRSRDTASATALFKYHSARGVSNAELSEVSGASATHVGRLINDKDGHEKRDGRETVRRRVQSRSGQSEAGSTTSKFTKRPDLDSAGEQALRDAMRGSGFYSDWKSLKKGADGKLQARHIPPALNQALDTARRRYNIQSIADYLYMARKSLQQHLDKKYGSVNEAAVKREPSPIDEEMPDAPPIAESSRMATSSFAEVAYREASRQSPPRSVPARPRAEQPPAGAVPIYTDEHGTTVYENDRGTQFYLDPSTGRWRYYDDSDEQWHDHRPEDPYGKGKNTRWAATDVHGTHATPPPVTKVESGIALLDPDQAENWKAARRHEPRPDEFLVFAHGTPDGIVFGDKLVTPEQLAARIAEDKRSHGKRIVLISCDTGAGDYDVRLARQPGITAVTAPTRTAWTTPGGRVLSASPDLREFGSWRITGGQPPVTRVLPDYELPAVVPADDSLAGAVAFAPDLMTELESLDDFFDDEGSEEDLMAKLESLDEFFSREERAVASGPRPVDVLETIPEESDEPEEPDRAPSSPVAPTPRGVDVLETIAEDAEAEAAAEAEAVDTPFTVRRDLPANVRESRSLGLAKQLGRTENVDLRTPLAEIGVDAATTEQIQRLAEGGVAPFLGDGRPVPVTVGGRPAELVVRAVLDWYGMTLGEKATDPGKAETKTSVKDIRTSTVKHNAQVEPRAAFGALPPLLADVAAQLPAGATETRTAAHENEYTQKSTVDIANGIDTKVPVRFVVILRDAEGPIDQRHTDASATIRVPKGLTRPAVNPPRRESGLPSRFGVESATGRPAGHRDFFDQVAAMLPPEVTAIDAPGRQTLKQFLDDATIAAQLPAMVASDGDLHPEAGWVTSEPLLHAPRHGRRRLHRARDSVVQMRLVPRYAQITDTVAEATHTDTQTRSGEDKDTSTATRTVGLSGGVGAGMQTGAVRFAVGPRAGFSRTVEHGQEHTVATSSAETSTVTGPAGRYQVVYDLEVRTIGRPATRLNGTVESFQWARQDRLDRSGLPGRGAADGWRGRHGPDRKLFAPAHVEQGASFGGTIVDDFRGGDRLYEAVSQALRTVPGRRDYKIMSNAFLGQFDDPELTDGLTAGVQALIARDTKARNALSDRQLALLLDRIVGPGLEVPLVKNGHLHDYHTVVKVTGEVGALSDGDVVAAGVFGGGDKLKNKTGTQAGRSRTDKAEVSVEGRVQGALSSLFGTLTFGPKITRIGTAAHTLGVTQSASHTHEHGGTLDAGGAVADQRMVEFLAPLTLHTTSTSHRRLNTSGRRLTLGRPGHDVPRTVEPPVLPDRSHRVDVRLLVPEHRVTTTPPPPAPAAAPPVTTPIERPGPISRLPGGYSRDLDGNRIEAFTAAADVQAAVKQALVTASGDPIFGFTDGVLSSAIADTFSPENLRGNPRLFSRPIVLDGLTHPRRVSDVHGRVGVRLRPSNPQVLTGAEYEKVKRSLAGGVVGKQSRGHQWEASATATGVGSLSGLTGRTGPGGLLIAQFQPFARRWGKARGQELTGNARLRLTGRPEHRVPVRIDLDVEVVAETRRRGNIDRFDVFSDDSVHRAGVGTRRPGSVIMWMTEAQVHRMREADLDRAHVNRDVELGQAQVAETRALLREQRDALSALARRQVLDRAGAAPETRDDLLRLQRRAYRELRLEQGRARLELRTRHAAAIDALTERKRRELLELAAQRPVAAPAVNHAPVALTPPGASIGLGGVSTPLDLTDRIPHLRRRLAETLGEAAAERLLPSSPLLTPHDNSGTVHDFLADLDRHLPGALNGGRSQPLRLEDRLSGHTYYLTARARFTGPPRFAGIEHVEKLGAAGKVVLTTTDTRTKQRTAFGVTGASRVMGLFRGSDPAGPGHGPSTGTLAAGLRATANLFNRDRKRVDTSKVTHKHAATTQGPVATWDSDVEIDLTISRGQRFDDRDGETGGLVLARDLQVRQVTLHTLAGDTLPDPVPGDPRLGVADPVAALPRAQRTPEAREQWRAAPGHPRLPEAGRFGVEHVPADMGDLRAAAARAITDSGGAVDAATIAALRDGLSADNLKTALAEMLDGGFRVPLPGGGDRTLHVDARLVPHPRPAGVDARVELAGSRTHDDEPTLEETSGTTYGVAAVLPAGGGGVAQPAESRPFGAMTGSSQREQALFDSAAAQQLKTEVTTGKTSAQQQPAAEVATDKGKLTRTLSYGVEFRFVVTSAPTRREPLGHRTGGTELRVHDAVIVRLAGADDVPAALRESAEKVAEASTAWTKAVAARDGVRARGADTVRADAAAADAERAWWAAIAAHQQAFASHQRAPGAH
ncbi:hypothetical protein C8E87_8580 [Paractinoplanes brasiliensis]|uniref:Uncharacterized protein n=2 Tax=Paractinoplanes brasiliensis TaxID=52695 RepID=A0A4R6JCM1_9ACTN|nr:hypothetical protein [Actinoplanes brasiliensis]TDO33097.1 hypothetical protein C8E87_8580 [Actinoplanes brasiliensis]